MSDESVAKTRAKTKNTPRDLSKVTFADLEKESNATNTSNALKEAMKLVRCTISCNNPNKASYTGDIFCVQNAKLPEVKKFVPFNVPTHVPSILLNMIREKQCQKFVSKRLPNGQQATESKLVPEYNIQILPPLTKEELEAIKQKQLAEGFTGE